MGQAFTAGNATITVIGWACDPNAPVAASRVAITIDCGALTTVVADLASTVANSTAHISGNHGYLATMTAAPGRHTVSITELNTGPGHNVLRGTFTVTVPAVVVPPSGP